MTLVWFVLIPVLGGFAAWALSSLHHRWARWVSLLALAVDGALVGDLLTGGRTGSLVSGQGWLLDVHVAWIPQLGISFHLAVDGLSLVLVALTLFLGIMAVASSWAEISERVGFFHFNLMLVLAGIIGVFLAVDLILFYFFWEVMLIPMYFLIGLWGHENRLFAAMKFIIFTQAGGLLMLAAILGLYFIHGRETGVYTFDYVQLLGSSLSPTAALWLMAGFFAAFAVKLPAIPFHTWLPDAHTEAPTAGSVVLAGLLLKTGAYGILRFVLPLFPQASAEFAPIAMGLGVVGIIYGSVLAFAQTDLKRLVAYTSVSHMGFVLLGSFAGNQIALQGVIMQIVCHGLSTGGLFILVGALQERIHSRDVAVMGGLWTSVPRMGGVGLVLALASLGLPGLGNFVGEFLVLLGTFQANWKLALPATAGVILGAIYSLWFMWRAFFGPQETRWTISDLSLREGAVFGAIILGLIWLGLKPQPLFEVTTSWSARFGEKTPRVEAKAVERSGGNKHRFVLGPTAAISRTQGSQDSNEPR